MRHVLLDVSVVADICLGKPGHETSLAAFAKAKAFGLTLWVYTGSVPSLEFDVAKGLVEMEAARGINLAGGSARKRARELLKTFCQEIQWLAALSGEGNVFESDDPEQEQLLRAMERFGSGQTVLLTLDEALIKKGRSGVLSPEAFLGMDLPEPQLDFIDLRAQQRDIRPQLESRIHRVLHHGQYIMGPEVKELESWLADYVGVKHAIAVASGTDSLEIALRSLGIEAGDEVITVPFTWISTAEVICQVGAKPVFIDIEGDSFNMNADLLEAAIGPRTKAILPVSLFGQMADYGRINAIAARHNVPVIEDGAQSFGATQKGRRSCGVTLIGSTSFFPAKILGCYGDGGALFTDNDALAERMRAIRTHGGLQRHHHPYVGMNGRLDTLQAAVLLAKLDRFDWEVQRRQEIGAHYSALIDAACGAAEGAQRCAVISPRVAEGNTHVYAQYTLRAANRDALAARLKEQGIPTAVYYPKCLHEQPVFDFCGYKWGDFPESEKASREVLSLPMHPYLTAPVQERIVAALRSALME